MMENRHVISSRHMLLAILILVILCPAVFGVQNVTITPGTVPFGEDITLSFEFDPGYQIADCWIYLDINQSGTVDPSDPMLSRERFEDNDGWDENPSTSHYTRVFSIRELFAIPSQFVVLVEDGGASDTGTFTINPVSSGTSLSGTVTQPANTENLVAFFAIMEGGGEPQNFFSGLTNSSGGYTVSIPDSFAGSAGFFFVGDQADLIPDWQMSELEMLSVQGHMTGHDVEMRPVTAWIYGRARDDGGFDLDDGYVVNAEMDGPSEIGLTQDGWYHIGVSEGEWEIVGDDEQLRYDYLSPSDDVEVDPGDSVRVDVVFYRTNSTISGTVYLDGSPYPRMAVDGSAPEGDTYSLSDLNGEYSLWVSNLVAGYEVSVDRSWIPAGYYVVEEYQGVAPGVTGIDFHLVLIPGGISGQLTVEAGDPVPDYTEFMAWAEERGGGEGYNAQVEADGTYEIRIPEGVYELRLGQPYPPPFSDLTYLCTPPSYDSVEVGNTVTPGYDYELNYAHARLTGELIGLLQAEELVVIGFVGDQEPVYISVAMVEDNFSYQMGLCDGQWNLIPPEVEGYTVDPPGYTFDVTEDDTLFTEYDFIYTTLAVQPNQSNPVASDFQIGACYPNPFNSSVVVTYKIPSQGVVAVNAYNVLGQKVAEVFRGLATSGVHRVTWEPEDLATGIYFLELNWQGEVQMAKVMYHK